MLEARDPEEEEEGGGGEEEEEEEARDKDGKFFQKGEPPPPAPLLFIANGATSRNLQRLSRSVMRLLASGVPETEILCRALRRCAIAKDWEVPADSIF